jgi:hypothetical protein
VPNERWPHRRSARSLHQNPLSDPQRTHARTHTYIHTQTHTHTHTHTCTRVCGNDGDANDAKADHTTRPRQILSNLAQHRAARDLMRDGPVLDSLKCLSSRPLSYGTLDYSHYLLQVSLPCPFRFHPTIFPPLSSSSCFPPPSPLPLSLLSFPRTHARCHCLFLASPSPHPFPARPSPPSPTCTRGVFGTRYLTVPRFCWGWWWVQGRHLALCMSQHPRLGSESKLALLDPALMR